MSRARRVKDDWSSVDSLPNLFQKKCIVFPHDNQEASPKISDLSSLLTYLPAIASSIFKILGSQQCEGTYQRCLKIDLEEAGMWVGMEHDIQLKYKGRDVGTRRADLVLKTASDETAVIEIKAVDAVHANHAEQLKYYMHHLDIDRGYLINFPHDSGFPRVDVSTGEFSDKVLHGDDVPSGIRARILRLRNDPSRTEVQVVELTRRVLQGHENNAAEAKAKKEEKSHTPAIFGITQKGTPCKICIREGGFCTYHKKQQKLVRI